MKKQRVICPALGRTGTTSLELALEKLGYEPVYSYFNLIKDKNLFYEWTNIFSQDDPRPDLIDHVSKFNVISDFPVCIYAEHLIKNYPDAKVILTQRDEEKWAKSILRLYRLFSKPDVIFSKTFSKRIRMVVRVFNKHVWPAIFKGGEMGDVKTAIQNYRIHQKKIISMVPNDNLLVFDVKDGWKPLCEFLNVNKPTEKFPHVNDGMKMIRYTAVQLALRKF